jgi:hypothetical protein
VSIIKRIDLELVEMVKLPLIKKKTLAKDMSLPFAKNLEGLNIRVYV